MSQRSGSPLRLTIMRNRVHLLLCVLSLVPGGLHGQDRGNPPAFEVASVKPADPNVRHPLGLGFYTYPGGRIVASQCPVGYLVEVAFDNDLVLFPGAPGWYANTGFDIEARPPADSASSKANPTTFKNPPNEEQRQMLQTLLAERFQLRIHRETKDGPVYLLVRGRGELKLQDAKNKDEFSWAGTALGGVPFSRGIAGTNISMAQFARRLGPEVGRPVLDRTGITGSFDFRFEYTPDEQLPDVMNSVRTSLQGLGLKLEPSTGPIESIVIDHVEKPSPN